MKLIWLILMLATAQVNAATILEIGTIELANNSEIVFEGYVRSTSISFSERGTIYTFVNFGISEVIVGDKNVGSHLQLRFTGGEIEGLTYDAGVNIPKVGERGIYFVERIRPGLINPLLGWDQGHFLVTNDNTVIAANSKPVSAVISRSNKVRRSLRISDGLALGIATVGKTSSQEIQSPPMSLDQFKRTIRTLVNE